MKHFITTTSGMFVTLFTIPVLLGNSVHLFFDNSRAVPFQQKILEG